MEPTEHIEQIVRTFDGVIIGDSGREAPSLDQRTLEDTTDPFYGVGDHSLRENPFEGKDLQEIFTEHRPYGPCHRIVIEELHGDVEASMVFQTEDHCRPKRKQGATVKRRTSGVIDPENLAKSVRRARKKIRHKCMMMKADKLLTLTTRAAITDRVEFCILLTHFHRKMRRYMADTGKQFKYLTVLEKHESEKTSVQKYGSYHAHIAFGGFIPYGQIRRAWKASVGECLGVNERDYCSIDVQSRVGRQNKNVRRYSIAKYMAKYISKSFSDTQINKKRYWSSNNIEEPNKTVLYAETGPGAQGLFIGYIGTITNRKIRRQFDSSQVDDIDAPPFLWVSTC